MEGAGGCGRRGRADAALGRLACGHPPTALPPRLGNRPQTSDPHSPLENAARFPHPPQPRRRWEGERVRPRITPPADLPPGSTCAATPRKGRCHLISLDWVSLDSRLAHSRDSLERGPPSPLRTLRKRHHLDRAAGRLRPIGSGESLRRPHPRAALLDRRPRGAGTRSRPRLARRVRGYARCVLEAGQAPFRSPARPGLG